MSVAASPVGVPSPPRFGGGSNPTTMPTQFTLDEVRERIAARKQQDQAADAAALRYVRPLSEAAEALIDVYQNPEGRYMLGLPELDVMIRGIGRGELCLIVGRAHSGKSAVALQSVVNNPQAKVLWYQWDESSLLMLAKLCAVVTNTNGETIEKRVRAGDPDTIATIRKLAGQTFRNLVIIDEPLSLDEMSIALREAEAWWSSYHSDPQVDVVILDFLELLPGEQDASGVDAKVKGLKRWGKAHDVPLICIHQANRNAGQRGKTIGMDSSKFGGDAEATFLLGVSRKRDDPDLDPMLYHQVEHTITVNVDKNKRAGGKRGAVDFHLDPETGRIAPLEDLRPDPEPSASWTSQQIF